MPAMVACSGNRQSIIHDADIGNGDENMPRKLLAFSRASYYVAIMAGIFGLAWVSSGRRDPWLVIMAVAFMALGLQFWLRWRTASRQRDDDAPVHGPRP
jgi:hypothetical protein